MEVTRPLALFPKVELSIWDHLFKTERNLNQFEQRERERKGESIPALNVTAAITALLDKSCKCYERKRRRRFFKWRLQNSFLRSAFAGWQRERERERERERITLDTDPAVV